jgi:hypothetical protein
VENKMGVDVYMTWKGFGKRNKGNPNYDKQITGFQDNGKAGYLRVSYGYNNYEEATSPFFWDWDKKILFTNQIIKIFEDKVRKMSEKETEFKKELLAFARLGRKLNKQGKRPKVYISY